MSEQSQQLIQRILDELHATRRRLASARALFGIAITLAVTTLLWALMASAESGFWFSTSTRTIMLWLFAAVAMAGVGLLVVRPALQVFGILKGPSDEELARRIGSTSTSVSDRLLSLLSLSKGQHSHASASMIDGAISRLTSDIDTSQFNAVEDFSLPRKTARYAAGSVLLVALLFILAPSTFIGASQRLLSPATSFERPLPFTVAVAPGSVELVRGSSLQLFGDATGTQPPESLQFELVNEGEDVSRTADAAVENGRFVHTIANVRQNFRYRARAGGYRSEWYTVTVFERPVVKALDITLVPPNYSRAPRVELDPNVGDVSGLRGTRVDINASIAGPEIDTARIVFDDGTSQDLEFEKRNLAGTFVIHKNGSYHLALTSIGGVSNEDPIEYKIIAQPDEDPAILLLSPDDNTVLTEENVVPFSGRIIDDYGFNRLALNYRITESRFGETSDTFSAIPVPLGSTSDRDQSFQYVWELAGQRISAVPGDEIEVFVEVFDNDAYMGYKSSRSNVVLLRFPSLSEQYEALEESQDGAEEELGNLLDEAESVRERFEELRDELRKNPESDWQNNREIEQLQEEQQRIEERVEEFTNEIQNLVEQMEENGLVSEETLQMYEELKKVSDEINSPELMEALDELKAAMEQMNLEAMQEAVDKFEFSEDQYQKRLERTLDLFKQFKMQQSLDEVENRAAELQKLEENIEEKTREADEQLKESRENEGDQEAGEAAKENLDDLAKEQEIAAEEMESLMERLEEIREEMKDVKSAPQQQMQEMTEQMQDQQMQEQMKENAEQLRQEQTEPAMQGQQQMQQQLNQMQQNLSQMQQNMTGSQMNINMQGLRQALNDVLVLSRDQERIRSAVENLAGDSHVLREYAQEQLEISEGLSTVSDSLQKMAREIPQMSREVQTQTGEALREMGSSVTAMSERVARRATGHQKSAMMHLNELAVLLSDLMSQLMNQQSGMGGGQSMEQMIEQMQNMAGQQQKLNQQIQELLNDAQGQRLSGDVQARLNQLAEQQENLRKQLKQMSRNPDLRGKLLGDLNKIAEQMLESVDDLTRRRMNRNMLERQQQILSRMLESTKSMQERGREEKRESKTGGQLEQPGVEDLDEVERADQLRRDLIRALEAGYSPDYEALIKRYFKLLEEGASEQ